MFGSGFNRMGLVSSDGKEDACFTRTGLVSPGGVELLEDSGITGFLLGMGLIIP
jgi:hypothetical protein